MSLVLLKDDGVFFLISCGSMIAKCEAKCEVKCEVKLIENKKDNRSCLFLYT